MHLLALSTAGLTEKHPVIKKGVAYLLKNFPENDVYSMGMYAVALQSVDRRKYKEQIKKAAEWLIKTQKKGTWNYTGSNSGDNSVTQFAILGLKAAIDSGINVPKKVLTDSAKHFLGTQARDGGWGYTSRSSSSASMTAAGLASLSVCDVEQEISLEILKGRQFCGKYKDDSRIVNGIKWLSTYMQARGPAVCFQRTVYGLCH